MSRCAQELLPDYRVAITEYFGALTALGFRLLHLLALALGLEESWFDDKFLSPCPIALLRPLHYSGRPSKPDEVGQIRALIPAATLADGCGPDT